MARLMYNKKWRMKQKKLFFLIQFHPETPPHAGSTPTLLEQLSHT